MTAPIRDMADDKYELYRVITDYEALQDGFLDRIDELSATLEQVDLAGGFARGNAQKLLTKTSGGKPNQERMKPGKRTFGWESLGKMLKGTGLALVLVVDDERFAPVREQMARRKRPMRANASMLQPTWLFTREMARIAGKKRWSNVSPAKRKKMMRKAAKAGWRKRRINDAHAALS